MGLLSVHNELFRGIYGIARVKMKRSMLVNCLNWLLNSVKVGRISLFGGLLLLLVVELPRRNLKMLLASRLMNRTVAGRTPHRMHNLMFMI